MQENTLNYKNNSVLVVAHPDDEILWFSSIIKYVSTVIVCFSESNFNPTLTESRQYFTDKNHFTKHTYLNLKESDVFHGADWSNPILSDFGMKIEFKKNFIKEYNNNYYKLIELLGDKLDGYDNIFTHNPWGDYGHEEHVQIYKVIKKLQERLSYRIWVSNYCSNRSYKLMLQFGLRSDADYHTLDINQNFCEMVKNLYLKHNCWTWYRDWNWFKEENYFDENDLTYVSGSSSLKLPLNFVKIPMTNRTFLQKSHIYQSVRQLIRS